MAKRICIKATDLSDDEVEELRDVIRDFSEEVRARRESERDASDEG